MAATVPQLAARALRRLGVVAVAASDRPATAAAASVTDLAARALQSLGITVPASGRPSIGTASASDLAARALQAIGVVVPQADRPANADVGSITAVANRALQSLGLPVPSAQWPTLTVTLVPASIGTDALLRLAVMPADQAPSTADQALAEGTVSIVHDNLVRQGIVSWPVSAIPRGLAEEYSILVALRIAAHFGKTPDPTQVPIQEERIKRFAAVALAQDLAEQHATAAHAALVGVGAASWDAAHIPVAVVDEYVALTRQAVAPLLNIQVEGVDRDALQERVRRVSRVLRAQADAEAALQRVHAHLVGAGQASWDATAIPTSVADDYVALTAADIAPSFGQAAQVDRAAIEARVQRAANVLQAQADAEIAVQRVHSRLVEAGLAGWDSTAIPAGLAAEYAALTAAELAPSFGQERQVDRAAAEEAVRRVSFIRNAQPLAEDAVMATHATLAAEGRVRWSIFDIWEAAEEPYVVLAAARLAPQFGRPIDTLSTAAATTDLLRLVALGSSGQPVMAEYF